MKTKEIIHKIEAVDREIHSILFRSAINPQDMELVKAKHREVSQLAIEALNENYELKQNPIKS